jgi:hypothetical protein
MGPSDDSVPPPFRKTSGGAIEFRRGGGILAVFGFPFLLASVYMMLGALGLVPLKDEFSHPWTGLMPAAISFLFLGVSSGMVFGRSSVIIDRSVGLVTRRISLIMPLRTDRRQLNEFDRVVVAYVPGDSDSPDRYPVRLRAAAGKDFTISSPTVFRQARQQAEFLARALHLPLADTTTEHEVIVAPEHAADTLQQRLRTQTLPRPVLPPAMHSIVSESSGETTIVIPHRIQPLAGAIGALFGGLMLCIVAPLFWRLLSHSGTPLPARLGFVGFLAVFFGIAPMTASAAAFGFLRRTVAVKASPSGLVIQRPRGMVGTRTESILATEILDIDYNTMQGRLQSARRAATHQNSPAVSGVFNSIATMLPNQGVIVKTRNALIIFGAGLQADELGYLVWILKKSLSALPDRR